MVPEYVQGGTRAGPVKCWGKAGAGGCFCYCKCLCCARYRGGGRAPRKPPKATIGQKLKC